MGEKKKSKKITLIHFAFFVVGLFILDRATNRSISFGIEGLTNSAQFEIDGDQAYLSGIITKRTVKDLRYLLKQNPQIKTIVLVDIPGSVNDEANLAAARLVRQKGLKTKVLAESSIHSGGTDFFIAGKERIYTLGAEIGVHTWSCADVDSATELSPEDKLHLPYLEYYREMGIPEDFYWFTVKAAPAHKSYIMTLEELKKYKIITCSN